MSFDANVWISVFPLDRRDGMRLFKRKNVKRRLVYHYLDFCVLETCCS